MRDRIHRHLDGELPLSDLSALERRELEEYRMAMWAAVSPVLREKAPDVSGSVMEELRSRPHPAADRHYPTPLEFLRALGRWFWRPWSFRLRIRPAWGLAMLATAAIVVPRALSAPAHAIPIQIGGTVMATSIVNGHALVAFRLDAPGAHSVHLAGDFTGWKSGPALEQVSPGVWSVDVPLDVGLHDYAFIVDGTRWVQDPLAEHVDDGFGGTNSRVAVLPPAGSNEA
jgi:hypothetical protein